MTVLTGPTTTVPQNDPPPPPPGLLADTRASWTAFWTSAAAQWVDRGAHMQRLARWIRDVDQWNRIQRDLRPTRPAVRQSRPLDPPAELSDGAREVWQRVVREYGRAALVADPDVLRAYCESVARYRHAEGLLASSGPLIRGRNGDLIRNPLHQVVVDNAGLMRTLARDLELTGTQASETEVPGVFDPTRPWLARGSTGQVSRHPSADEIDKLDARIHRAEVEFGMTPYAGVRLGLAGVQGALTAEQLARLIRERAKREPDPGNEEWAEGFAPG